MLRQIYEYQRYWVLAGMAALTVIALLCWAIDGWPFTLVVITGGITALGVRDMMQTHHAVTRNYPIIGHMRFLFEKIRPEIRQYFVESDQDEVPFSREQRALVYQRAKGAEDKRPFGTMRSVYESGFGWLTHSINPTHFDDTDFRVKIGGDKCKQPYDASLFNISAMSFGSLSANAISALNKGAKLGGFAHDTGEGGISKYHKEGGGDLIYELGSAILAVATTTARSTRQNSRNARPSIRSR